MSYCGNRIESCCLFFAIPECGSVVNNTLKSPGYPNDYPIESECNYSVPIPKGMAILVTFHYFLLEVIDSSCE